MWKKEYLLTMYVGDTLLGLITLKEAILPLREVLLKFKFLASE